MDSYFVKILVYYTLFNFAFISANVYWNFFYINLLLVSNKNHIYVGSMWARLSLCKSQTNENLRNCRKQQRFTIKFMQSKFIRY